MVEKVTGEAVKKAVQKMKAGKSDISGSYTSDALLHSPDIIFDSLAEVFSSFLVHGTASRHLLVCAFLPLLKSNLKDPASTESYRAIAGSSLLLKLFDNVVLLIWGHHLTSDTLQFGFKPGVSTTQCSWLVQEVAGHYLRSGTPVIATLCDCTKAFDLCQFDLLFEKLLNCGMPAIVARIIIFCYEEQAAWVKWGNVKSEQFGISNGTRQGAVLSPPLFSLYLDDLLKELRALGVGCHMGGLWMGATCYADDLLLLAPTCSAMEAMIKVCEKYAIRNNISFSTHENPVKSKTKCLYICGDINRRDYPATIKLNGKDLPFVTTATHLGHELSQDGSMTTDIRIKRAKFIDKSTEIRETFSFADPVQVLGAANTYCCDHYGSMLWDLFSEPANQYYRCWNTCTKLAWNCPRSTHTYFVTCQLAADFVPIRIKILASYVKFFRGLCRPRLYVGLNL